MSKRILYQCQHPEEDPICEENCRHREPHELEIRGHGCLYPCGPFGQKCAPVDPDKNGKKLSKPKPDASDEVEASLDLLAKGHIPGELN